MSCCRARCVLALLGPRTSTAHFHFHVHAPPLHLISLLCSPANGPHTLAGWPRQVLGVDQLGFDLRVETVGNAAAGGAVRRIGFKLPPQNLEEALSYFVKLFQESWERSEGYLE